MASVNDKITDVRNAARPVTASVSSPRSAGGTSLSCDSLTGWPTASKVHFVTYTVDSNNNPVVGSQLDCYGIVSGSTIGSFTVIDGNDAGNSIGDKVEMLPTAAWGQDLADALTNQHTRVGAHTGITTDTIAVSSGTTLPAGDIGTADLAADAVTADKLADAAVFPANLTAGLSGSSWAWQSYTPTVTLGGSPVSNGNAVITGAYAQIGKTIHYWVKYVIGTTTTFSGLSTLKFSLPVTASSAYALGGGALNYGAGQCFAGGTVFHLDTQIDSSTTALIITWAVNLTYMQANNITATVPGTWTTGNTWGISGTYEAA